MDMKGAKAPNAKELLSAAERQMIAARETDRNTSALLQRIARKYAQRALDALLVERGGGQAVPIT